MWKGRSWGAQLAKGTQGREWGWRACTEGRNIRLKPERHMRVLVQEVRTGQVLVLEIFTKR